MSDPSGDKPTVRQQKIERNKAPKQPTVIVQRDGVQAGKLDGVPMGIDKPVRAVLFAEVYDMSNEHVKLLVSEVNRLYTDNKGGVHYVVPVRNGKVTADILFEHEILPIIKQLCEVQNGEIVLKNGADPVHVVRETV